MKSLNMSCVKSRLSKGRELIGDVAWCAALGIEGRIIAPIARATIMGLDLISISHATKENKVPEYVGACVSGRLVRRGVVSRLTKFIAGHIKPQAANDLSEDRSRLSPDAGMSSMVIVYHEGNKAGRHIDIHIGRMSIVKRLPDNVKLSFDGRGHLTQVSKDKLMDIVRTEFRNRARIAQNLDHSPSDARFEWHGEGNGPSGYGSGPIREVISDEPIYIYNGENAMHFSAPHIVNNKPLFMYQLYPGTDKRAPIMSIGYKDPDIPVLRDKVDFKFDHDLNSFMKGVGNDGDFRIKYDGSSCYIIATPHGTRIYSPRTSEKDGKNIEYSSKLPGVEKIKTPTKWIGMGELLMTRNGKYLENAEQGGVLNAMKMPPKGMEWEIRVYRTDSINGNRVGDITQEENIGYIKELIKAGHGHLKVPEKVPIQLIGRTQNIEGVIGVPKGKPLSEGHKLKWRTELQDGIIKDVGFKPGPNGGIEGVITYEDWHTGGVYHTSSGLSHEAKMAMADNKEAMIGVVMRLKGFRGHPGRAAIFQDFHQDKGKQPPKAVQDAVDSMGSG
jgi:hypothetical protein